MFGLFWEDDEPDDLEATADHVVSHLIVNQADESVLESMRTLIVALLGEDHPLVDDLDAAIEEYD